MTLAVSVLTACLGGCGSPGRPSATPPWLPAGTVLTFTSGETGLPVSGASVGIEAVSYTTDAAGRVSLRDDITSSTQAMLTVTHPAYLQRQTYQRSPDETSLTLWPSSSPTGIDATYAKNIVYGATMVDPSAFGIGGPLRRLQSSVSTVAILPSDDIQRDVEAMAAHRHALAIATMATEGRVAFTMDEAPPGALVIRATTDQTTPCPGLACARLDTTNFYIAGGEIVFQELKWSRLSSLVLHELGHVLGFWHSATPGDIMLGARDWEQDGRFSPRELLVLRLMYQRRAGNRWPDDDRGVAASSSSSSSAGRHTEVISCDFGGR